MTDYEATKEHRALAWPTFFVSLKSRVPKRNFRESWLVHVAEAGGMLRTRRSSPMDWQPVSAADVDRIDPSWWLSVDCLPNAYTWLEVLQKAEHIYWPSEIENLVDEDGDKLIRDESLAYLLWRAGAILAAYGKDENWSHARWFDLDSWENGGSFPRVSKYRLYDLPRGTAPKKTKPKGTVPVSATPIATSSDDWERYMSNMRALFMSQPEDVRKRYLSGELAFFQTFALDPNENQASADIVPAKRHRVVINQTDVQKLLAKVVPSCIFDRSTEVRVVELLGDLLHHQGVDLIIEF